MFVKYDCGCIGLILHNLTADGSKVGGVLLYDCRHDEAGPGWFIGQDPTRHNQLVDDGKTFEPLSRTESARLLIELSRLVQDGYAARDLRAVLDRINLR